MMAKCTHELDIGAKTVEEARAICNPLIPYSYQIRGGEIELTCSPTPPGGEDFTRDQILKYRYDFVQFCKQFEANQLQTIKERLAA